MEKECELCQRQGMIREYPVIENRKKYFVYRCAFCWYTKKVHEHEAEELKEAS